MVTGSQHLKIGTFIRERRRLAGLTQEALAHAIGCSKPHLSLMESGQRSVSLRRAKRIETALAIPDQQLISLIHWQSVPPHLRAQMQQSQSLSSSLRRALASDDPLEELRRLIPASHPDDASSPSDFTARAKTNPIGFKARAQPKSTTDDFTPRPRLVPIINKVAAGYPADFTDLDYPASIADDYIACPDLADPDAFAARVVGDSMTPDYLEGDIVIFSPKLALQAPAYAPVSPHRLTSGAPNGIDCFVRLERDSQTTFKRIYFQDDGSTIRLQPLNNSYPPQVVHRNDISGLYPAAYVMRKIHRP